MELNQSEVNQSVQKISNDLSNLKHKLEAYDNKKVDFIKRFAAIENKVDIEMQKLDKEIQKIEIKLGEAVNRIDYELEIVKERVKLFNDIRGELKESVESSNRLKNSFDNTLERLKNQPQIAVQQPSMDMTQFEKLGTGSRSARSVRSVISETASNRSVSPSRRRKKGTVINIVQSNTKKFI